MSFHVSFFWTDSPCLGLEKVSISSKTNQEAPSWFVILDDPSASEIANTLTKHWFEAFLKKEKLPKMPLQTPFSSFARLVLEMASQIPFGTTISYEKLAQMIGKPKAHRAVARALASNPYPLIIPCHRIIGKDGTLRGYREGIIIKEILINFEK